MTVSTIAVTDIADYLRLETGEYNSTVLQTMLDAAKAYISSYTGIPETATEGTKLDDYPDFVIAVYVLCQDMHDNRSMYVDKNNVNRVVETILGMHCVNLL